MDGLVESADMPLVEETRMKLYDSVVKGGSYLGHCLKLDGLVQVLSLKLRQRKGEIAAQPPWITLYPSLS
jgi:hypothetical protein